jgi:glycosyltransferase involved in cell wall biosynthesis
VTTPKSRFLIGSHALQFAGIDNIERINPLRRVINLGAKPYIRNDGLYYHAINKAQKEYMVGLGVERDRVFHVPNFIDAGKFKFAPNNRSKLAVVHIGGVNKSSDRVVEICRKLAEARRINDFVFYFIGERQPDGLRPLARRYKRSVFDLGLLEEKSQRRLLTKSDVMIIPAFEAFPLTMLEGLASGLSVITDFDYNPVAREVNDLGASVYDARNDDVSTYAERLIYLKDNKDIINRSRYKNNRVARGNFDSGVVLPKIEKMFLSIGD